MSKNKKTPIRNHTLRRNVLITFISIVMSLMMLPVSAFSALAEDTAQQGDAVTPDVAAQEATDITPQDAAYFTVYTKENATSEAVVAKQYTQAEFEALASDSTDAVSGMFYKSDKWNVVTAATYVKLSDLLTDAGIADKFTSGAQIEYGGNVASGKSTLTTYDSFMADKYFYPAATTTGTDTTGAVTEDAVLAITTAQSAVSTTAADAVTANVAAATNSAEPRMIRGVTEASYLGKNASGMRYWSNVDHITIIESAWSRLSGSNRYATMGAIVKQGSIGTSDRVILAAGGGFADALAASGLAGIYNCPIVTTATDTLSPEAREAITNLGAKTVYILGGTASISQQVVDDVKTISEVTSTERISGDSRIDTALRIYNAGLNETSGWTSSKTCIIARGYSYADALSIAPYAYASKTPIFLAGSDGSLTDLELAAINGTGGYEAAGGFTNVIVLGGQGGDGAILDSTLAQLTATNIARLDGNNRLETSKEIALWATGIDTDKTVSPDTKLSFAGMGVANAWGYPDALASASLLGPKKSVLLLVDSSQSTKDNIDDLVAGNASIIGNGYIFGGTASVGTDVEGWLNDAMKANS